MKPLKSIAILLLVLFALASVADAALFGRKSRSNYGRGGITVRSPGGGSYTWYGPGGVAAARRAAERYSGRRYAPRRNTTPVQRDIKQKDSLRFVTFPSVASRD